MSWERFNDNIQVGSLQKNNRCFIDSTKKPREIEKFNALNQDFSKLVEWLDWFWKTEYKLFKENLNWPVLVIFQELHNDDNVKKENFETFIKFREYFNFLATEGADYELNPQVSQLQWDIKNTVNFILWWFTSLSSVALEEYYWDSLNTCWVDLSHEGFKELDRKKWGSSLGKIDNNTSIDEMFSRMESRLKKLDEHIEWAVVRDRNNLWLQNMKNILITWNNSDWKNFIPIIAGWAHAQDLSEQAKKFWFKWVIIFTPKSYN